MGLAVSGNGTDRRHQWKSYRRQWHYTSVDRLQLSWYFDREIPARGNTRNDVNCAALGEKWLGAGKDKEDFICLTIGTGIGGGLILNNDLYRGQNFVAAEFDIWKLEPAKNMKSCINYSTLKSSTQADRKNLNGLEIFNLEKNNISPYVEIIKEWIEAMTDGLASLIYIFNPKTIIIGGGVTGQGQYF